MNKVVLLFASLILLCSCEEKLSSDGMAMRQNTVPGTNIPESQVGVKNYTVGEFTRFVEGRRYERMAVYDFYKKWGDTYYVIMDEDDNGDPVFNSLSQCTGCGRDVRQFEGDEMMHWAGSIGCEVTYLYNYTFTYSSQKISYGLSEEYVVFVNDEYMITQDEVFWDSSYDAGAMFSRTVYKSVEKEEIHTGKFTDCRETVPSVVLFDEIPQTNVEESQLASSAYSASRFAEITNGRCFECIAEYTVQKKDGAAYYEIVGRNDNGDNVYNMLEGCIGCSRDVLIFKDNVLTHLTGPSGYEETGIYSFRFDEASQRVCFGRYKLPVAFVDYEYLVVENVVYENGDSGEVIKYVRKVYKHNNKTGWTLGTVTDHR